MNKILVIDDEVDAVRLLMDFLEERGYSVVSAQNGEEGIGCVDTENPDIIITDIKMPRLDGLQFLKEIRSKRRWIPVILLSVLAEPVDILKGYNFEADYYLTKPINLEELLKAVRLMSSLIPLRRR